MRILMTAAEMAPLAKSGGLGDVVGALPNALARLGHEVTVVIPLYGNIDMDRYGIPHHGDWTDGWIDGEHMFAGLHRWDMAQRVEVYLVKQDHYYGRHGIYGDEHGPFGDNERRFAFLAQVTLQVARRMAREGRPPHLFHGHDWHAGLVPVYLAEGRAGFPLPSVFTIHNIGAGYQGRFGREVLRIVGLDDAYYHPDRLELWGSISFLKGGLVYSHMLSTVSRRFAQEIMQPEVGDGLDGYLRHRRHDLVGIRNGIDTRAWDPRRDPHLVHRFWPGNMAGKDACKAMLQETFGLPVRHDVPVIGMVTRLTEQKGLDLLLGLLRTPAFAAWDVQLAILGTGEARYEDALRWWAARFPGRIGVELAFDEPMAHRVIAGSDLFLMPSRYEPCGLTQMYSIRYGTIPVVRATGGLDDVVQHFNPWTFEGNGFKFDHYDVSGLRWALSQALEVYRDRSLWRRWRASIMDADFSWETSARHYEVLYEQAVARHVGGESPGRGW